MISAKVLADSRAPRGERLTTMELTFPRWLLPELLVHKDPSRCGASSRAIPCSKIREQVRKDPAMPVYWGKNQSGMQAAGELTGWRRAMCIFIWASLRWVALLASWMMSRLGLHKQLANRPLELWVWYKQIISGTEWDRFFTQRIHKDAQPELQVLACEMLYAMQMSEPRNLEYGDWHTPLVAPNAGPYAHLVSAGRCAAVSYGNHFKHDFAKDLDRAIKMLEAEPRHMSPFEHVAIPGEGSRNFRGWIQYREIFEDPGPEEQ